MKLGEKGFTLLELLVVTTIVALIANGAMMGIFQVLRNTERNKNQMTAVSQVENAGYWISLDAQKAQTVEAEEPDAEYITVSWEQDESGDLEESGTYVDILYFAFSGDGGSSWSDWEIAFTGDWPPPVSPFSYPIPEQYLTDDFRMRFYLNGPNGWIGDDWWVYEYAYIDNIAISEGVFFDDCSSFANWNDGRDWRVSSGEFRGHHDYSESDRYLTMSTSLDLSSYLTGGFPLTFTWITWDEFGGTEHQVIYSIVDGRLMRSYSIGGGAPIETYVAQYIDLNKSNCRFANRKLTFTVTATVGSGPAGISETRRFQVLTRPD